VLLVLREPIEPTSPGHRLRLGPGIRTGTDAVSVEVVRAVHTRLARRVGETVSLLAPAGITVTALNTGQATAVIAAACNPDALIPAGVVLAGADDIITTHASGDPFTDSYDTDPYGTGDAYETPWPAAEQAPAGNAADGSSDELWWAR
jgi:hypothetical protein